jgi:rubrerythrin
MKQISLIRIGMTILAVLVSACPAFCGDNSGAASLLSPTASQKKESKIGKTLLYNLQTAYSTEANEAILYNAFGKRADEEGYGQVASLFRALAQAEQLHSVNKAVLMKGTVEPHWDSLDVRTTIENLDWALEAEKYENDTMYPRYVSLADKANNNAAEQSYRFCLASEQRHIQILQQARNDLADYTGANIDFFVCPRCGNTVRSLSFETCPVCAVTKENFTRVR